MTATRPATRKFLRKPVKSVYAAVATTFLFSLSLGGCSSLPQVFQTSKAEVDPKLGVKPSPRVVAFGQPVPKGGGRSMVGKPYVVAGKRYTPKLDPSYEKVGLASWYGDAFHGRKTANGEVFDANSLTAAHPTMPLPSYARVTSLSTGRSVMVRVNDRGPFHSNRVLDMSRRTAEMLGIRSAGVAKVKVEYVSPAAVEGSDERLLMASYRGPSDVPVGMPETMVASAAPLPGVNATGSVSADGTANSAAPMAVAAVLPPDRPIGFETYVMMASADPADIYISDMPVQVAAAVMREPTTTLASYQVPDGWEVGAQPASFQAFENTDVLMPVPMPPPRSSYADDRVGKAYAALDDVTAGVGLGDLTRSLEALSQRKATQTRSAQVQVGVFGETGNAERIAEMLSGLGTPDIQDVTVDGKVLKRVRISALAEGITADDVVAAAIRAGAAGARAVR
jgi:rare lipoprotein A